MTRMPYLAVAGLLLSGLLAGPAVAQEEGGAAESEQGAEESAVAAVAAPVDYNRELLTVEEEVHSLKEQVFRAKATLQLLKEIVVQGSASGSRATVRHENRLGKNYTVESIAYYLDGQGKFSKADPTGGLDEMRDFKVFDGAVPPGSHNLTVTMRLRGNGFGIFSYVKNYTFNVQNSVAFTAEEGKNCRVTAVADERKGIGRSFIERPQIVFESQCVRLSDTEQ